MAEFNKIVIKPFIFNNLTQLFGGIHLSRDTFCRLNAKCRRGRRRSQGRIVPL